MRLNSTEQEADTHVIRVVHTNKFRHRDLQVIDRVGVGRPSGEFSNRDVLILIYFTVPDDDYKNPRAPNRGRFILSKGDFFGAPSTTRASRGFFVTEETVTYISPLPKPNGLPAALLETSQ